MSTRKKNTDPWAALAAELGKPAAKHPTGPGWKTFKQIREASGGGEGSTRNKLRQMLQDGRLERFRGIEGGCNQVWYRPTKKPLG